MLDQEQASEKGALPAVPHLMPQIPCAPPADHWNDRECWVWKQIQEGSEANFNKKYDENLDPKQDDAAWRDPERPRQLSARFLTDILVGRPWSEEVHHRGVRILGARVTDCLDLSGAEIDFTVWLDDSRFEKDVSFPDIQFKLRLSLEGSRFRGIVNLDDAVVKGDLVLRNCLFESDVKARDAVVSGSIWAKGAAFRRSLDLQRIDVRQTVAFTAAQINQIDPSNATVGKLTDFARSKFEDNADFRNISVGQDLKLGAPSVVDGGGGCALEGRTDLEGAQIGGDIILSQSNFSKEMKIFRAAVGRSVLADRSSFSRLEMSGVHIGRDMSMISGRCDGALGLLYSDGNESGRGISDRICNASQDAVGGRQCARSAEFPRHDISR